MDAIRLSEEYAPLCEAMYLMMSSDGEVSSDEREVLRGALRNLSGDVLRTVDIDALLDGASTRVAGEGRDARMRAVAGELAEDRARAEVTFVLAAAIAFADNAIANGENETLDALADCSASTRPGRSRSLTTSSGIERGDAERVGAFWTETSAEAGRSRPSVRCVLARGAA